MADWVVLLWCSATPRSGSVQRRVRHRVGRAPHVDHDC